MKILRIILIVSPILFFISCKKDKASKIKHEVQYVVAGPAIVQSFAFKAEDGNTETITPAELQGNSKKINVTAPFSAELKVTLIGLPVPVAVTVATILISVDGETTVTLPCIITPNETREFSITYTIPED